MLWVKLQASKIHVIAQIPRTSEWSWFWRQIHLLIGLSVYFVYALMEVRGQLPGVGFSHFGFCGIDSDHQSWQQASLPAEPSHQPRERGSLET